MAKDIIVEDTPPVNPVKVHLQLNDGVEKLKSRIRHCSTVQTAFAMLQNEQEYLANQAIQEFFGLSYSDVSRMRLNGFRVHTMRRFRFDHD